MTNIIKADLYRLLRGKGIYITTALLVLVIFFAASGDSLIHVSTNNGDIFEPLTGLTAPFWLMSSPETIFAFLIPFIIFVVASDFSSMTVKNALSAGEQRVKFYLSKLVLTCMFSILIIFTTVILGVVFATIGYGFGGQINMGFILRLIQMLGTQIFMYTAITSVGVFLAFTTKNAAAVICAYLAFCFIPTMIITIFAAGNSRLEFLYNYDIAMRISRLANIEAMTATDIRRAFALGGFYILASTIIGIFLFKKCEIK